MDNIIYTHTCDKCHCLQRTDQLLRVEYLIICAECYNDSLEKAGGVEFFLLKEMKKALPNEFISTDRITREAYYEEENRRLIEKHREHSEV